MKLIIPALLAASAVSAIVATFDGTLITQAQAPSAVTLIPTPKSLYEAQSEQLLPPLEPVVSERERALGTAKLKEAFNINGEKMCCGFIDTSNVPCYEITGVSGQVFFECGQPTMPEAKKIKTEVIDPKAKNSLDAIADKAKKKHEK